MSGLLGRFDRLASTALSRVGVPSREQRRAQEAAEQRAAAQAAELARRSDIAQRVNRPFLRTVQRWSAPDIAGRAPKAVADELAAAAAAARALFEGPSAARISSGECTWAEAGPGAFEHLLRAAEAARGPDPRFALEITGVLLTAKPTSRAAWRRRALIAEALGETSLAIEAHRSYLENTPKDRTAVLRRVEQLRDREERLVRLHRVVTTAHDLGGPLPGALKHLREMTGRPTPRRDIDQAVGGLLRELVGLPTAELNHPAVQDLLHHLTYWNRHARLKPAPLPEDDARGLRVLRLNDLRHRLSGARLCLIAPDSNRLHGLGLGDQIDAYDLVVRFAPTGTNPDLDTNSGTSTGTGAGPDAARTPTGDPDDLGTRTDLQVIRHDADTGWETDAEIRMILADQPEEWVTAVRSHLVPGWRGAITERSLRRPLRAPVRAARPDGTEATDAYQVLRLIDLIAACQVVDLVGFRPQDDFPETELDWLAARLEQRDANTIGVR